MGFFLDFVLSTKLVNGFDLVWDNGFKSEGITGLSSGMRLKWSCLGEIGDRESLSLKCGC